MGESEPTLRDVLGAVREIRDMVSANGGAISEIREELGEVRVGLGSVRGRLARLDDQVAEHGKRLDRVEAKATANGEAKWNRAARRCYASCRNNSWLRS